MGTGPIILVEKGAGDAARGILVHREESGPVLAIPAFHRLGSISVAELRFLAYVEPNARGASCRARRRTALNRNMFNAVMGSIVITEDAIPRSKSASGRCEVYDKTPRSPSGDLNQALRKAPCGNSGAIITQPMPLTSGHMLGPYGIRSPIGAGAWALFSRLHLSLPHCVI